MDNILKKQQAFFKSEKTMSVDFRLEYLKKLKNAIKNARVYHNKITLSSDLIISPNT